MTVAIEFTGVNKWFGEHHVLVDVDLKVDAGEVIVVCGPSGSGKSTLIRCVNRLEPVQKGQISVHGEPITGHGTNLVKLRTGVGMVFQSFNLFPHMTVLQNIMLAPRKVKGLGLRATMRRTPGATGSSRPYSNENSRRNGISTAMPGRLHEIAHPPQGFGLRDLDDDETPAKFPAAR